MNSAVVSLGLTLEELSDAFYTHYPHGTGTLPSNFIQQPMRIKDSSAVHSSCILLAVSKGLPHTIELVDRTDKE